MMVATKMAGSPDTSLFAPDAPSYARSAVNTIGNAKETTGYVTHQLEYEGMNLVPEFILDMVVKRASRQLKEAAMAKKEKE